MTLNRVIAAMALATALFSVTACQCKPPSGDRGTEDNGRETIYSTPARAPGLYTVFKNNTNNVTVSTEKPVGFVIVTSNPGEEYWIVSDTETAPVELDTMNSWMHMHYESEGEYTPEWVCNEPSYGGMLTNPHVWHIQITQMEEPAPCE